MDYPEKATWYIRGVDNTKPICDDCPSPPRRALEKIRECCKICPFQMIIWLFNKEQGEIWKETRPLDMKKKDIEKAVNERRIAQVEKTIGRVPEIAPLPLFLVTIYDNN